MTYKDSVIEQSTVQKLLWNLLPLLCLLAMANVLDRLDLSYAAPAMGSSLHLTSDQLRTANNCFYVGYLVAGLPAAGGMLVFGARRWICGIVIAWGVIAMAHAVVWSEGSLYALRILLGMAEANLMPAMVFYLTEWMPPRHRSLPIAAIVAAASLVPLLGEQASNLILLLPQWFGITDWRWLFLVEGVPAVWLGLHVLDALPQNPPEASWLPHPERHWLITQLRQDERHRSPGGFFDGLRSMANWRLAGARLAIGAVIGSLGMWVPLAMQQTGYLAPGVGAVIMGAAAMLGAVGAVVTGLRWNNGRWLRRSLAIGLALIGLALAIAAMLSNATAGVLLLAAVAALVPAIAALTWILAPYLLAGAAAAAGFAVLSMAGTLGDFCASELDVVRHDVSTRCLILALVCFAAALLALGMDGRRMAGTAASATAGE
ncbi:MAG TPA: MFS transporter [Acetobacteraceae bacterium]|nr:MFS transporter [Acetobacteraceae bacterium]